MTDDDQQERPDERERVIVADIGLTIHAHELRRIIESAGEGDIMLQAAFTGIEIPPDDSPPDPIAPTFTALSGPVIATNEDTETAAISFAALGAIGDENDPDGTVVAFIVTSVTSGTLTLGTSPGGATPWASGTNDRIEGAVNAYWTPAQDQNGTLNAFALICEDDDTLLSSPPVQAQVTVNAVNDIPTMTTIGVVDATIEDTEVEITFAEILAASDAADVDGTVDAFVIGSIVAGTARIGATQVSATPWASGTNDVVQPGIRLYWTPPTSTTGTLGAFLAVARDNMLAVSDSPIQAEVTVASGGPLSPMTTADRTSPLVIPENGAVGVTFDALDPTSGVKLPMGFTVTGSGDDELPPNCTGVTIGDVWQEHTTGVGTLRYTHSGETLSWQAAGDTEGTPVAVGTPQAQGVGGYYKLLSGNGTDWIFVFADGRDSPRQLPSSDQQDSIDIGQSAAQMVHCNPASFAYRWTSSEPGLGDWDHLRPEAKRADGTDWPRNQTYEHKTPFCFTQPGAVTFTLEQWDQLGVLRVYEQELTCTAFAGTTIYFHQSAGSDANPGTDPANPKQTLSAMSSAEASNTRLALRRGETWNGTVSFSGAVDNFHVGAYDDDVTGADSGVGEETTMPKINSTAASTSALNLSGAKTNCSFMNLHLSADAATDSSFGVVLTHPSGVGMQNMVYRYYITDSSGGIQTGAGSGGIAFSENFFWYRCKTPHNSVGNDNQSGITAGGANLWQIGCDFGDSRFQYPVGGRKNEHIYRGRCARSGSGGFFSNYGRCPDAKACHNHYMTGGNPATDKEWDHIMVACYMGAETPSGKSYTMHTFEPQGGQYPRRNITEFCAWTGDRGGDHGAHETHTHCVRNCVCVSHAVENPTASTRTMVALQQSSSTATPNPPPTRNMFLCNAFRTDSTANGTLTGLRHASGRGALFAGNIVYTAGWNEVAASGNPEAVQNNVTSDPLWVDGPNDDFRIQAGSPAIGLLDDDLAMYVKFDKTGNMRTLTNVDAGVHQL